MLNGNYLISDLYLCRTRLESQPYLRQVTRDCMY